LPTPLSGQRLRPRSTSTGSLSNTSSPSVLSALFKLQAQTAELRTSIDSIRQLVAALEASQKASATAAADDGGAGAGASGADGGLTVSDLRQELRSFAETLQE